MSFLAVYLSWAYLSPKHVCFWFPSIFVFDSQVYLYLIPKHICIDGIMQLLAVYLSLPVEPLLYCSHGPCIIHYTAARCIIVHYRFIKKIVYCKSNAIYDLSYKSIANLFNHQKGYHPQAAQSQKSVFGGPFSPRMRFCRKKGVFYGFPIVNWCQVFMTDPIQADKIQSWNKCDAPKKGDILGKRIEISLVKKGKYSRERKRKYSRQKKENILS